MRETRVLFVCLGNICRSPMAEAVLRARVAARGLAGSIRVASRGTAAIHAGKPADPRALAALDAAGYRLEGHVARQVDDADLVAHDWIVALEPAHLHTLRGWLPADFRGELVLLTRFARVPHGHGIEDPYHAGAAAFDTTLRAIEAAVDGLLDALEQRLRPVGTHDPERSRDGA